MSAASSRALDFIARLDAVEERLQQHLRGPGGTGLTPPDPRSGEQWDEGQVWAHLAEFLPYWIDQADLVVTYWHDAPVPFGRVKADPDRIAAIERDRGVPPTELIQCIDAGIAQTRAFLQSLPDRAWQASGRHQTLGVMPLATIVDEFLIGHLEEHADQLDQLRA